MTATKAEEREQYEMICIEAKDHILRKIDSAIDFTHIYDLAGDLYCPDNGRPGIEPAVVFKMVLIQHMFGIPSLRKTAEEVKLNVAYRWGEYIEFAEDIRHTPKYKKLYGKRKETIKRVFADAKEKYGMRYTLLRGLTQVTNWVRLKFAAMNLKKFAIRRWNKKGVFQFYFVFPILLRITVHF